MQQIIILTKYNEIFRNISNFINISKLANKVIQIDNVNNIKSIVKTKDIIVVSNTDYLREIKNEITHLPKINIIAIIDNNFGINDYNFISSYCVLPLNLPELLIKIKLYVNDINNENSEIRINNLYLRLNFEEIKLFDSNLSTEINFTQKEGSILKILFQNYPNELNKHEILQYVWGHDNIDSKVLESHISNIRKKLSDHNLNLEIVLQHKNYKLVINDNVNN
ncbi:winged helix-turn-helix domain-containing protein [Rickettsiales bacterium LUAb2]